MSQQLVNLAENAGLPQLFVDQLAAGERITMWYEEVSLIKAKVWDVYQDVPGQFQLRLQIQGFTGNQADGYPLEPLPEDLKAAGEMVGFWTIQGYVAVSSDNLEPDVAAAMSKFVAWSLLNKETKQEESSRPKLWFEAGDSDCGLQLLPKSKVNKQSGNEELTFSGWAHRGLEWCGTGIGSVREVEFDASFTKRPRRGARVDAPAPTPPKVIPPTPPKVIPSTRGRGQSPQAPQAPEDQSVLAANV